MKRTDSIASETAVLVGVLLADRSEYEHEHPLDELQGLAETAGARVVGRITQRRDAPDVTTYLGKGKLGELQQLAGATDADVVLFDNDLSPAQIRNLEQSLGVKVLDRTELILDIFAGRAKTYEARLAVEMAQLQYSLPRLKRMWTHLSRIKMGIGMRGPGEKQLEVDRRLVEKRIHDLGSELKSIQRRKEREVAARRDRMTVSLVGYTNAGKSTLLNTLTGAGVLAEDKLFATLDTRTRRWQLPGWGPVLLSDTVGFIRDLPHHLIASFKATLEEARQANLLLHVADASNPAAADQIAAVYEVLEDLGIQAKDTILALNKVDAVEEQFINNLRGRYPNAIPISAKRGRGLNELACAVSDSLSRSFVDIEVETGVENGRLQAFLSAHGEVLSKQYQDSRVVIHCRISENHLGRLRDEALAVRPHRNGHAAGHPAFNGSANGDQ
jgi:GTP-binding protein HflX